MQVAEQFNKFAAHKRGLVVHPVFGGQSIERQIQALRRGVHIVIGTPGRILDHIARKTIDLASVEMVVLDEADKMLDMGFREDIERILKSASTRKQTLLFSATMAREILALTKRYQNDPVHIKVAHEKVSAPAIDQLYLDVEPGQKLDTVTRLIDLHNPQSTIIFCNTKRRVDDLVNDLKNRGYQAVGIHGDITQEKDEDSYVHRIGRTGRAGKSGTAFSLVSRREFYSFKDIKRYTQANIKRISMPTDQEVAATRHAKVLDLIKKTIQDNNLGPYANILQALLDEDFATLDVCAALLKLYIEKK
ncbi:DEAD/DEAH box helicase [bacterium]|nr:DEAD/DEAH box helicase [bacterium]